MNRQLRFSIWFPIVLVTAFAAGYLFWQKTLVPGPYDLEPVSIVRNGGRPSPELVEGWQTYRNEKYGFEVKYPSNWREGPFVGGTVLGDGLVSFNSKQTAEGQPNVPIITVSIATIGNPLQLTLWQLFKNEYEKCLKTSDPEPLLQCNGLDVDVSTWPKTSINGWEVLNPGNADYYFNNTVFIINRSKIIEVGSGIHTNSKDPYLNIRDQILSTFKFIE